MSTDTKGSVRVAVNAANKDLVKGLYTDDSKPLEPKNDSRKHPDTNLAAAIACMSFAGFTTEKMLSALRISREVMMTHYRDEWENGHTNMLNDIASSLANRARAGSDTAAIFLLKTRGGGKFSERQAIDLNASVEVTYKTELVKELAGLLSEGRVIEHEP